MQAPILPARLDWPSAIGNFLLNYGTLDWFLFTYLKDHFTPEEFVGFKKLHLRDRLDRIETFLMTPNNPADQHLWFSEWRGRLEPIREMRNHIAHGHMLVSWNELTQQPSVSLFQAKDVDSEFSPHSNHLSFNDLVSSLRELNRLIEEFSQWAGFIHAEQSGPDLHSSPPAQAVPPHSR